MRLVPSEFSDDRLEREGVMSPEKGVGGDRREKLGCDSAERLGGLSESSEVELSRRRGHLSLRLGGVAGAGWRGRRHRRREGVEILVQGLLEFLSVWRTR